MHENISYQDLGYNEICTMDKIINSEILIHSSSLLVRISNSTNQ